MPLSIKQERERTYRRTHGGFSLVELMTVVLVVGLSLVVGVPMFQTTIKNNRLQTETYALRATLSNARSEALARRIPVTVCETDDGEACATSTSDWTNGYLAFADDDNDRVVDAGEDIFLAREINLPSDIGIRFRDVSASNVSNLRFSPQGDSLGFSGTFVICDDRGVEEARAVILSNSGQVRIASDTSDSGVVNGLGGADVTCP